MIVPDTERPLGVSAIALRVCCLGVWLAVASLLTLILAQWRMAVLHPAVNPLVLLIALAILAAFSALGIVGWRLVRNADRGATLLWASATFVPLFLFAIPFEMAHKQWTERGVPHGTVGQIPIITAASLMEGQAAYFYPHRWETERLTMFYRDLEHPQRDAEAMDQHVAELAAKIGHPLRSKIHWVRGTLIGQGNASFLGLALGSTRSPLNWDKNEGYLDRHELAHAVITQQRPVTADPPMLLHEGWAESQSGLSWSELANRARHERETNPDLSVFDLLGPDWYHRDSGPVYTYGGALVDFLIRRFGVGKFVELYNRCQSATFDADFRAVYDEPLAQLESSFWQEIGSSSKP
jgi:hypothetical protein